MRGTGRGRLHAAGIVAMILAALWAGGCNIVGPASYIIAGPPKADALVQLPDVPTLVYIDDRNNVVNPVSLRRVIGDTISTTLMQEKVLTTTISSQDAMAMTRQKERNGKLLTIEEIGNLVGAKQVIYITMIGFQDTPDGMTPRPMSTFSVKVIDVEHHVRVYPPPTSNESAHKGVAMIQQVDPSVYSTRSGRVKVFDLLAKQTGSEIAKMFYGHEIRELGERVGSH